MGTDITNYDARRWANEILEIEGISSPVQRAERLRVLFQNKKESIFGPNSPEGPKQKFSKVIFDESIYPALPKTGVFNFPEMIDWVDDAGFLRDQEEADRTKFLKELRDSSLAQILYVLVWKQGQRNRVGQIARGLSHPESRRFGDLEKDRVVFHQFGKHIANRDEPIVDQHSARAQQYLDVVRRRGEDKTLSRLSTGLERLEKWRRIRALKKQTTLCNSDRDEYKNWVKLILPYSVPEDLRRSALSSLDKYMYSLGKIVAKIPIDDPWMRRLEADDNKKKAAKKKAAEKKAAKKKAAKKKAAKKKAAKKKAANRR
jgi:hypothetical protein